MQGFKRPIKTSCWTIYQYQDLIWPSDSQQSQFTVKSKLGPKKKKTRNMECLISTDSFLPFKGIKIRQAA